LNTQFKKGKVRATMSHVLRYTIIGFSLLLPSLAQAQSDTLIEGAKQCTKYLPRFEREYGIPTHLLSAIASTESGRYHQGLKLRLPWPWAINAEGKGYFFETKDQAIAAVRKLRAQGVKSIDVGCMQINLHHHPDAFNSLEQAFEPQNNVRYAANFLHTLYNEENSWKKAAASYHSKTPKHGNRYVGTVYDSWYTIIERLRAAKLQVPDTVVASMNELKNSQRVVTLAEPKPALTLKTTRLPEQSGIKLAAYTPPRMNTVIVTASDSPSARKSEMMVLQPASPKAAVAKEEAAKEVVLSTDTVAAPAPAEQAAPVRTAEAAPAQAAVVAPVESPAPMAAAAPVEAQPTKDYTMAKATAVQIRRSGPSFIFND
jgi:hypothetical protein